MSSDKLADIIRSWDNGGDVRAGYRAAANRVREAFVVIDRNDLPEVKPSSDGYGVWAGNSFFHPDQETALRATAYQYLAVAEDRRKSPVDTADEGKVAALRQALAQVVGGRASHGPLDEAARLIVTALTKDAT